MFRLGKRFGVAGIAIALAMALSSCGTPSSVAGAGSATTFGVMNALLFGYNGGSTNGGDTAYNIPPQLTGSAGYTVNGDSHCGTITYNASNPPPNGSSAGINALVADTQGCIDFARSSRPRGASDPANLEFYAFGRDAVTWAHFAGNAPTNLSQAQLQGIYICDQPGGLPKYTNWNQVGGNNAAIRRYLPQLGSGTLSYFETRILGLTSAQQGVVDDTNCATAPVRLEENNGSLIGAVNRPIAIVPYSFADWTAQANGVVTDVRAGIQLGSINGVAPNAFSITADTFLGTRYVFNVTKTSSPSYDRALNFVGVRPASSGGNGYICADDSSVQFTIAQYGFIVNPLAPAGAGLPNSRCRKDPAPL